VTNVNNGLSQQEDAMTAAERACKRVFPSRPALDEVVLFGRVGEKQALDDLVHHVHEGESGALVLYGEAGMGKTALLDYASSVAGVTVVRIAGAEAEQSFGFAALHRLLRPLLHQVPALPSPQRAAIQAAFGLSEDMPPDRYLVGLASLGIMAIEGTKSGLLCIIDDAQWIDRESLQALAFAGRRLNTEGVGILLGFRTHLELPHDLDGLPTLEVPGLSPEAAAELLKLAAGRSLGRNVIQDIVDETDGCPLALQELGRELGENPSGTYFRPRERINISRRLEEHFLRQVATLSPETQLFLLVAASETSGSRGIVGAAASFLGCPPDVELEAVRERILIPGPRIRFRHPLIRSAVYSSAEAEQRRLVHRTLSTVVGKRYPDRWARHVVLGSEGPNEQLAMELAATAEIARSRGGYSAQMVLLTSAANLSDSVELRSARLLLATRAAINAGANEQAGHLLDMAEAHLVDPTAVGEALQMRGQLTIRLYQPAQAPTLLLAAARQFLQQNATQCRDALLETFDAYSMSQHFTTEISPSDICEVARKLTIESHSRTLEDRLLLGTAELIECGVSAAQEHLLGAADFIRDGDVSPEQLAARFNLCFLVASELLDDRTYRILSERIDRYARETGALTVLLFNLFSQAEGNLRVGGLEAANACYAEALDVASAIGFPAEYYRLMNVKIEAWRGNEKATVSAAKSLIKIASNVGVAVTVALAHQALAILYIGHCRYEEALASIDCIYDNHVIGYTSQVLALGVEAAVGSGNDERAVELLQELKSRAIAIGTPWFLGLLARSEALLADSETAEEHFQSSLEYLGRTSVAVDVAHTRLLYGDWLRRVNRRVDARDQLREAHDFFESMGAANFAARAGRALRATGERTGSRSRRKALALTPQELRIAQLAAERLTNPEIAAQLFISSATVDYHLRKVFRKLGIESRRQLADLISK
jgi:DNA-binding CsgD family transcriptional regulator